MKLNKKSNAIAYQIGILRIIKGKNIRITKPDIYIKNMLVFKIFNKELFKIIY